MRTLFATQVTSVCVCLLLLAVAGGKSIGPGTVKRDRMHYSSAVAAFQPQGGFTVHSGKRKPDGAFVAVPYDGQWFWIARDDLLSKTTLSLVTVLFSFLDNSGKQSAPVLTIPTN